MTGLLDDLQDELTKSAQNSMHGSWHYFAATHKLLYADTERCGKYFKQAREAIAARPKNQNPTEALDLYAQCDFWYRTLAQSASVALAAARMR